MSQPYERFEVETKPEKEKKIFLGMTVKKETTFWNVLSIMMIYMVTTAAGAYYNT
jgi:hypothetical protein